MPKDQADLAGRRILVVEDEYMIADDLVQAFEKRGADIVGPVQSVERALALLDTVDRLDAAVLDVNLQGEMAFCDADKLMARGVSFVFTTGYDSWLIP